VMFCQNIIYAHFSFFYTTCIAMQKGKKIGR
jgi:hypothetical protein